MMSTKSRYAAAALSDEELQMVDELARERRMSRAQMLAALVETGLNRERELARIEAGETQISAGFASRKSRA
jgi:predicted transcriptional regulator